MGWWKRLNKNLQKQTWRSKFGVWGEEYLVVGVEMESRAKSRPLRNRSDQRIWSPSQCRCLTMHIERSYTWNVIFDLILDLHNVCCTQPGVAICILMQQVDCAIMLAGWTVDRGSPRQISELWVLILHFAALLYLCSDLYLYTVFEVHKHQVGWSESRAQQNCSVFVFCNIYTSVFLYSVSCICIWYLLFVERRWAPGGLEWEEEGAASLTDHFLIPLHHERSYAHPCHQ